MRTARRQQFRLVPLWCALLGALVLCAAAVAATAPPAGAQTPQQPEYVICKKAAKAGKRFTGHYDDNRCTQANPAGEGKYEAGPVSPGAEFVTTGKAATFYYHSPATGLAWQVKCAHATVRSEIAGPHTSYETIGFEGCKATDLLVPGSKPLQCQNTKANLEGFLVDVEKQGGAPGILFYPGFAGSFACETVKTEETVTFGAMEGFEAAPIPTSAKHTEALFAVNTMTGAQAVTDFYDFEEKEQLQSQLTAAVSGTGALEVGLELGVPLGGGKELVVIG